MQEAHRLAGEIDYILKVRNTRAYDARERAEELGGPTTTSSPTCAADFCARICAVLFLDDADQTASD